MTSTITARVDADKRQQAEEVFSEVGLTLSGAINLFINEVVMCQGIPFPIRRRVPRRKGSDFSDLAGRLAWRGDAVLAQRRIRDEW